MGLFRKAQNKYRGLFLSSIALGAIVALSVSYYIFRLYYEDFVQNYDLIAGTAFFIAVCTLALPNVIVALFYNDDKIWEDRLIAILYAMRFIDLRKTDLNISFEKSEPGELRDVYERIQKEIIDHHESGSYLNWRRFNAMVQEESIQKIIDECGPSQIDAERHVEQIEVRLRALHRLNNRWFTRTTLFLFVWSLLCAILLYISYVYLTSVYQAAFPYWYEFDKRYADELDYFIYAANATVKGFFANIFDIFRENPPFFVIEQGELIILSAKSDVVEVQLFEYVYRTFIALSLIPLFVSVKRLLRRWRLIETLRQRIGVKSAL